MKIKNFYCQFDDAIEIYFLLGINKMWSRSQWVKGQLSYKYILTSVDMLSVYITKSLPATFKGVSYIFNSSVQFSSVYLAIKNETNKSYQHLH